MTHKEDKECIVCNRTDGHVPLTHFTFMGTDFWICSQHIPIIIHEPSKLIGLLPEADKIPPAEDI